MMISSGWDPSVSQGTDNWMLPILAIFIVGTDGIVRARFVDPDCRTRMAIEDMLAALRSACFSSGLTTRLRPEPRSRRG
jgi:peroxiredoxin